jgi:hypothetical protein
VAVVLFACRLTVVLAIAWTGTWWLTAPIIAVLVGIASRDPRHGKARLVGRLGDLVGIFLVPLRCSSPWSTCSCSRSSGNPRYPLDEHRSRLHRALLADLGKDRSRRRRRSNDSSRRPTAWRSRPRCWRAASRWRSPTLTESSSASSVSRGPVEVALARRASARLFSAAAQAGGRPRAKSRLARAAAAPAGRRGRSRGCRGCCAPARARAGRRRRRRGQPRRARASASRTGAVALLRSARSHFRRRPPGRAAAGSPNELSARIQSPRLVDEPDPVLEGSQPLGWGDAAADS